MNNRNWRTLLIAFAGVSLMATTACSSLEYGRLSKAGIDAQARADYPEAEKNFKAALLEAQKGGDRDPNLAPCLVNLGRVYREEKKYNEAEETLSRALDLYKQNKSNNQSQDSIDRDADKMKAAELLAQTYQDRKLYKKAEDLGKEMVTMAENQAGDNGPTLAVSLNNLGTIYKNEGKWDEAIAAYKKALAIVERTPTGPMTKAGLLNNLGTVYSKHKQPTKAESYLERSLAILKKLPTCDPETIAAAQNNLAQVYEAEGKHEKAQQLTQEAQSAAKK